MTHKLHPNLMIISQPNKKIKTSSNSPHMLENNANLNVEKKKVFSSHAQLSKRILYTSSQSVYDYIDPLYE